MSGSYTTIFIFPHQLFENIKPITNEKHSRYYLVEEPLFFSDPERIENFNGLKLLLHRASMKFYADYLSKNGLQVDYIEFANYQEQFLNAIKNANKIIYYDTVDHLLEKRLQILFKKYGKKAIQLEYPGFMCTTGDLEKFMETRKDKKRKFFQTDFYRWQRKRLNILLDEDGDFLGGKLSFDTENRKSAPKQGFDKIDYHITKSNKYIEEARHYVSDNFPNAYGNVNNYDFIAFDFTGVRAKLKDFLKNRLQYFGTYEDVMDIDNPFLYHSLLSGAMNIGLITPHEIVETALEYFNFHQDTISINQIEGFVRQIIGWREYYRMVYLYLYDDLVKTNLLGHTRELTEQWYNGSTSIVPVDHSIHSAFDNAYLHHILRLMVVGQFMLLCEIHPHEIYRWFMEFAIDSYDWVMVPNVYGMVGFNVDGEIITKPYISSSNYIMKMSNFKKGTNKNPIENWDYIWRAMYYRFIHENLYVLNKNSRTRRMVWQMNRLKGNELAQMLNDADDFIENVTKS